MNEYLEKAKRAEEQINKVILGKSHEVREVLLAVFAGGHILLEDIPGTGKTTLALAFSRVMRLDFHRVQFTPDVMPSDLTGFSVYKRDAQEFVYQQGSVFCNLLLADEINRTSPKTQSALLEVMEEHKVSVDGVTRSVPEPFTVIATQNPIGTAGTQRLPDAQVDRFMINLSLGYPDFEHEVAMAESVSEHGRTELAEQVLDKDELLAIQKQIYDIYIKDTVYRYIVQLVAATRNSPYIERGASPRATIALVKMSRAAAWLSGRDYVTPEDVAEQFYYTVSHRITLSSAARAEGASRLKILAQILRSVERPPLGDKGR